MQRNIESEEISEANSGDRSNSFTAPLYSGMLAGHYIHMHQRNHSNREICGVDYRGRHALSSI